VTALEEEIANELLKMVGNRGKGNAQGSPDLDEGRSITPKPSRPTLTQIFVVRPVSLLGMVTLLHVQESKAHLLVAALHAAVPLKQVHSIAKLSILGIVALLHVQESKAHLLVAALHAAVPLKQVHSIAKSQRHTFWWRRCTLQSLSNRYMALLRVRGTPSGGGVAHCNPSQTDTRHCQDLEAHLLVAALHAAVPLKEVHGIAELISKDLDFNVARPLDEPLQQNALISEGCSSLPLG